MSSSVLPRVRDAQKKAEESRYYMLRANRQLTTLALARIYDQLETERVDFNARLKQEALDLKLELLRRAEEERAALRQDEEMLREVQLKIARRRKQRAEELQQQEDRKTQIKRRIEAKRKDRRFERRAPEEEAPAERPQETSGGGQRGPQPPAGAASRMATELDLFMPPVPQQPKRTPRIRLDRDLIFPNARKPTLYRELMAQTFRRETSRVNEKSLRKLREKYRSPAAEEAGNQAVAAEVGPSPYVSSISHLMYQVAEDSRQTHLSRLMRQVADPRDALRLPPSDRLKATLEACVRRRKKRAKKERKEKEKERPRPLPAVRSATIAPAAVMHRPQEEEEKEEQDTATAAPEQETKDAEEKENEKEREEERDEKEEEEEVEMADGDSDPAPADDRSPKAAAEGPAESAQPPPAARAARPLGAAPLTSPFVRVGGDEAPPPKRVTLKGPTLTPIQSTDVSPQSTREPTLDAPDGEAPPPRVP